MARPCAVCNDARRERIDGLLLTGQSVAAVWASYVERQGFCSLSALYRHARSHVGGLGPLRTMPHGESAADSIARLVELADLQQTIAERAAARGAEAVALRASAEERATRLQLLERLGADADAIASELTSLRDFADVVRAGIRHAPEATSVYADHLDAPHLEEYARDLHAAAAFVVAAELTT